MERTHICGGCGSREDVGYLVDATIAALQARVNGLEKDSELLRQSRDDFRVKYESVKNDAITLQSQLTQRTAERDTARRRVDELEAREVDVVMLREDLEQRTAELEAANHSAQTFQTLWRESCNQRDDLQAELERVRADNKALDKWRADVTVALQRPEGAFFVDVPQHIKDLVKERDDLRTLVVALPKVEYEIKASNFIAHIWPDHDTEEPLVDLRASVAALLKHRQGMEG